MSNKTRKHIWPVSLVISIAIVGACWPRSLQPWLLRRTLERLKPTGALAAPPTAADLR